MKLIEETFTDFNGRKFRHHDRGRSLAKDRTVISGSQAGALITRLRRADGMHWASIVILKRLQLGNPIARPAEIVGVLVASEPPSASVFHAPRHNFCRWMRRRSRHLTIGFPHRYLSLKDSIAAILKATISATFPTTETIGMKSDAIRQLFCERYLAGFPYRDICRELGISKRTAGNWAREMGLLRRRGGPRRQRWVPDKAPKIG
jgi:hypothetical protein